MKIRQLENAQYAGRRFTARYQTNGYYEITAAEGGFRIAYTPFEAPAARSFDDVMFGEWLEAPVAFGAFEQERLLGFVEGSIESWNNRFRISNLCVFDKAARGQGIGSMLMARITEAARARGARMLVLETQSCNEAAIAFYRKNGFSVIGFDLYAYSNADPERREVRIEMGKKLGDKAMEIRNELSKYFMVDYDDTGSIGKRYRREDEIGTPYCITVDFDTVGDEAKGIAADNCVTVRDRDTMEQVRMPISELKSYIESKIEF